MPLATNIAPGQADHAELHNEERRVLNRLPGVDAWMRSDSFNRADGALGSPDLAWGGGPLNPGEVYSTLASTPPVISGNQAVPGSGAGWCRLTGVRDIEVAATIVTLPSSDVVGLLGRALDGANRGYIATVSSAGKVRLYKRVSSTDETLDESEEGVIADGDRMALRLIGSTQVVLVNGEVVAAARDTAVDPAQVRCGFGGGTGGWALDNFTARQIVPGLLL